MLGGSGAFSHFSEILLSSPEALALSMISLTLASSFGSSLLRPMKQGLSLITNFDTGARAGLFSAMAAAQLHHRYDVGRQDNGTMETDLSVYSARQFQVSEANTLLFDLTTGPRSQPFEGALKDVTLKPFVTGRYVSVHDQPTYWTWGAGN